jgi:TatD DNase family protein
MLADIHCHLEREPLINRIDALIADSEKAGMGLIITSGVTPRTNDIAFRLAEKYPIVQASAGLYPLDAIGMGEFIEGKPRKSEPFSVDEELERLSGMRDRFVAIGEVGLDFNWTKDDASKKAQKEVFQKIIDCAEKWNKPVIVHSRAAELECIEILETTTLRAVLHCFHGRKTLIKRGIDAGFSFSIPPNINRLQHFQTVSEMAPIEQLLTETDSPWLGPQPGVANEPKNVAVSVAEIAKVKKLDIKEAEEAIWQNAQKLFMQ